VLRPFEDRDLATFAALNADPAVTEFLGQAPTRAESDAMVQRFAVEMAREGWGFWAVEITGSGAFVGMVGLHRVSEALPCAPAVEIGWRLAPSHWGAGYATEAAAASLAYGFGAGGLREIVAFTAVINHRSRAVMERIGMVRDAGGDFDHPQLGTDSALRAHVLYRASP